MCAQHFHSNDVGQGQRHGAGCYSKKNKGINVSNYSIRLGNVFFVPTPLNCNPGGLCQNYNLNGGGNEASRRNSKWLQAVRLMTSKFSSLLKFFLHIEIRWISEMQILERFSGRATKTCSYLLPSTACLLFSIEIVSDRNSGLLQTLSMMVLLSLFDGLTVARVPKQILKCKSVSREINFSSQVKCEVPSYI